MMEHTLQMILIITDWQHLRNPVENQIFLGNNLAIFNQLCKTMYGKSNTKAPLLQIWMKNIAAIVTKLYTERVFSFSLCWVLDLFSS